MAVQTSISAAPAVGLAGQMASTEGAEYTSKLAEETIAPGLCVNPGDTNPENTCRLTDGANDVDGTEHFLLGIAVLDPYRESADYVDGESVRIVTKGDVLVTVTTNTSVVGGAVFCVVASGAIDGTTGTAIPGAKFLTAAAAGELAIVRLNGNV